MATGPDDEATAPARRGDPIDRTAESEPPPVRARWRDHPHPSRFDHADPGYRSALDAHDRAVADDLPGYLDPRSGLFVMTSVYLRRRGWCCDRGCRHCPYVGAATATGESPR